MAAIQSLKKQLRGIRSTQKLTKAMKTISSIKFSNLNEKYRNFSSYGAQCRTLFEKYGCGLLARLGTADENAPPVIVVMASNKGLCGSFNSDLLSFAASELAKYDRPLIVTCGKKAAAYFKSKNIPIEKECVFNDIPTYEESSSLLDELISWRKEGKVSDILIVYPRYINMMTQSPALSELFRSGSESENDGIMYFPDMDTIITRAADTVFRSMFYDLVLQTAIGAQAATLLTMRSAFDTASEYCTRLEGEINRMRQSAVTADVLETSVESSW